MMRSNKTSHPDGASSQRGEQGQTDSVDPLTRRLALAAAIRIEPVC